MKRALVSIGKRTLIALRTGAGVGALGLLWVVANGIAPLDEAGFWGIGFLTLGLIVGWL
jgi:hypothetical protein